MKIGKLYIKTEDHPTLGKIFVIETSNDELTEVWESQGDKLKLRISESTALLLAGFIDNETDEQYNGDNNA